MGKDDLEIELFKGKNEAVIHLRIPQAMNDELLLEAEKKAVSVSEIVRDAIRMNLAPKILGRQVEKGFELVEGENCLDGIVDYYADLSVIIEQSETALRKAKVMQQTIRLIEKQVEPVFKKVFEKRVRQWQLEQEKREKKRRQEEREQDLAGIRQKTVRAITLSEEEMKNLSPKQKKERDLVF